MIVVLKHYSKQGPIQSAERLLEFYTNSNDPIDEMYNLLIDCCGNLGNSWDSLRILSIMEKQGLKTNHGNFKRCLQAFSKNGNIKGMEYIINVMKQKQFQNSTQVLNTMMQGYKKAGQYEKALQVFEELNQLGKQDENCEPDFYSFSILIDLYSKLGRHEAAAEFLKKMVKDGLDVKHVYFHSCMESARKKGDFDKCLEYFEWMKEYLEPNVDTFNILVSLYGFQGNIDKVDEILEEMKRVGCLKDRYTIGTLVRIYGDNQKFDRAVECYKELKDRGMYPTSPIITTMMRISMLQRDGIESTMFYYNLGKNLGILSVGHVKDFALCHLLCKTTYQDTIKLFLNELGNKKLNVKCLYLFVDAILRPGSLETLHLNKRMQLLELAPLEQISGKLEFDQLIERAQEDGVQFGGKFKKELDLVRSKLV